MAKPVKGELRLLARRIRELDYNDDAQVTSTMVHFVISTWSKAHRSQFGFVATRNPDGSHWRDIPIPIHSAIPMLEKIFERYSRWEKDLYWCPVTFEQPRRKAEFACRTDLGWADIDDSDPETYQPKPGIVWETSPGRTQGLWKWHSTMTAEKAEAFSKALTKRHGGDDGWTRTKMLRIPGSINHKPEYDEPFVRFKRADFSLTDKRPELLAPVSTALPVAVSSKVGKTTCAKVLKKYRKKLHPKTVYKITEKTAWERDRSSVIHLIASDLYDAGATPAEIAAVLWVNPYFISKHGQDAGKLDAELSRILSKKEA